MPHPSISNYFISLDEAKKLSKSIKIPIKEEKVKIEDSYNRILSQDIFSMVNDPPFDNSSMDGYAVIYSDTINATEELTGFPGKPNNGVSFQNPNNGGEPGLILILQNKILPSVSIIFLTKSKSPIDTPPEVIIKSEFNEA